MGTEITPDKDPLFSFDGAEGIAFWVNDEKKDESVKVMLDELPRLRAFLEHFFPQHDDRYHDFSDMTWERLIDTYQLTGPVQKGWVTFRGGPRDAVRDTGGRVFFDMRTRPPKQASRAIGATFEAYRP